MQLLVIAISTS